VWQAVLRPSGIDSVHALGQHLRQHNLLLLDARHQDEAVDQRHQLPAPVAVPRVCGLLLTHAGNSSTDGCWRWNNVLLHELLLPAEADMQDLLPTQKLLLGKGEDAHGRSQDGLSRPGQ